MTRVYLHWKGPGYYGHIKGELSAYWITTRNNQEAEALAKLAGLEASSVAYFKDKPESSEFVTVLDETDEKD